MNTLVIDSYIDPSTSLLPIAVPSVSSKPNPHRNQPSLTVTFSLPDSYWPSLTPHASDRPLGALSFWATPSRVWQPSLARRPLRYGHQRGGGSRATRGPTRGSSGKHHHQSRHALPPEPADSPGSGGSRAPGYASKPCVMCDFVPCDEGLTVIVRVTLVYKYEEFLGLLGLKT